MSIDRRRRNRRAAIDYVQYHGRSLRATWSTESIARLECAWNPGRSNVHGSRHSKCGLHNIDPLDALDKPDIQSNLHDSYRLVSRLSNKFRTPRHVVPRNPIHSTVLLLTFEAYIGVKRVVMRDIPLFRCTERGQQTVIAYDAGWWRDCVEREESGGYLLFYVLSGVKISFHHPLLYYPRNIPMTTGIKFWIF